MCDFCGGNCFVGSEFHNVGIRVHDDTFGNALMIDDTEYEERATCVSINYCPMCGRNLTVKERD